MASISEFGGLEKKTLITMYRHMVKSRVLEERLIKIYRAGESYFWIGGPGEEAWGVPLGMLGRIGEGPAFDRPNRLDGDTRAKDTNRM